MEFASIMISLLFTAIAYLSVPILIMIFSKKVYTEKILKRIAIINAVIIFLIFTVIEVSLSENSSRSVTPALIWGMVSYSLIKRLNTRDRSNPEKDEEQNRKLVVSKRINAGFQIFLIIALVISLYSVYNVGENLVALESQLAETQAALDKKTTEYDWLLASNTAYQKKYEDMEANYSNERNAYLSLKNSTSWWKWKADFLDEYVVFTTTSGNKYHKCDCYHLSDDYYYWLINDAIRNGYTPCNDCH